MADFNQFGSATPPQSTSCAQCEAMLADLLDGTLPASDKATFDLHVAACPACTAMLADARSGADWLAMLKPHRPEPTATLLERILIQTSGITNKANERIVLGTTDHLRDPNPLLGAPAWTPAVSPAAPAPISFRQRLANLFKLEGIRHTLMQPRLAMTAAMAFFSIALTLNLTGVRITDLRARDFTPSAIKRTFYNTNARVMRTFDNMRVVYELESRVRDLQRASDNETSTPAPAPSSNQSNPAPSTQPSGNQSPSQKSPNDPDNPDHKQAAPRPKSGSSRREDPQGHMQYVSSLSGRGLPHAATHDLRAFAPDIHKQQGGLA
ncbi:MAG TPA: zf-HC2 domain-containing protein [Edaphobacter sp.]